ncbi:hypothetical protein HC928_12940 [bacterium]|nr:hypothetical protein [bacterium]
MTHLQAGIEILQEQGARSLEASAYKYLRLLYQTMGDGEKAVAAFDQAMALATELGIPMMDGEQE